MEVKSAHYAQLDGLRAVAVMLVMGSHYLPPQWTEGGVMWGRQAVLLFFVLSGYLITGILLDGRGLIAGGQPLWATTCRFYIRRCLRIFPLYYAVLGIAWWIDAPPVRETIGWHLPYLSNVYFVNHGSFHQTISGLWSLSVEEQFYLVWPWVILCLPRHVLGKVIIAGIVTGPLFRLGCVLGGKSQMWVWVLTPSVLDSLGMGALLAYLTRECGNRMDLDRFTRVAFMIGALGACGLWCFPVGSVVAEVGIPLFGAMIYIYLIHRATLGLPDGVGMFLGHRVVRYTGKISYGIYLLHLFVPSLLRWTGAHSLVWSVAGRLGLSEFFVNAVVFPLIWSVTTLTLAAVSWEFFERPINRLKHRFPYRVDQTQVYPDQPRLAAD